MTDQLPCPHCGKPVAVHRNPLPTVDIIIELIADADCVRSADREIVLIKRKNPPFGWALPGGFVDYGESLESAAFREAEEETSLKVELLGQLGAYSDPRRDSRHHSISVVFVAQAQGVPAAKDDAAEVKVFTHRNLPHELAFDHSRIIQDYFQKWSPAD